LPLPRLDAAAHVYLKAHVLPQLMSFVKDMKKVAEKHAVAGLVVSSAGRF
jgi:hypothetical protein